MECPNCGASVPAGTSRCRKCGSYVEAAPAPPQAPVQPVQVVQGVPVQPQVVAGPPVKSKVAAGLLGIFLGWLGIHRFYLGHVGIGITQLLLSVVVSWFTCGLSLVAASIWGLVEGILILAGAINRDAQGRSLT